MRVGLFAKNRLSPFAFRFSPFSFQNAIIDFQSLTKKMQKKCIQIWSCQKFAVLLHPLSLKKRAAPKS